MDHYGQMAMEFSRDHRPSSHARITDPAVHFEEVGRQIATEVSRVRDEILGGTRPDEDPAALRTRSSQALATAREIVVSGHPAFMPETAACDEVDEDPDTRRYQDRLTTISDTLTNPM